jgi:hypothetical protein
MLFAQISQRNMWTSKSSAEIGHTPISTIAAPHLSQTVVMPVVLNSGILKDPPIIPTSLNRSTSSGGLQNSQEVRRQGAYFHTSRRGLDRAVSGDRSDGGTAQGPFPVHRRRGRVCEHDGVAVFDKLRANDAAV